MSTNAVQPTVPLDRPLSTNAVQLTVPIGDDGQLMSGPLRASSASYAIHMQHRFAFACGALFFFSFAFLF